jgi:predicted O-linked N-acetylglucosamine transferase (SPINDLY family)
MTVEQAAPDYLHMAPHNGHLTEAVQQRYKAHQQRPDDPWQCSLLGRDLAAMGRVEEAIGYLRRATDMAPEDRWLASNYLWYRHYLLHDSSQNIALAYRTLCETFFPDRPPLFSHSGPPNPDRRLRIGYVSPNFCGHFTAHTVEPILDGHDRQCVEIYAYGNVTQPDEVTQRFREKCHVYRDVYGLNSESIARLIARDRIDILVEIEGHCTNNSLEALAYRPAPIQVDYGAINTTGMKQIDYRLTDPWLDPADGPNYYVETSIRLPGGLVCYRPPAQSPMVSVLPALENGYVTFGSFNNNMKMTPFVISLWARILQGCDQARMLIRSKAVDDPQVRAFYLAEFVKRGIHADRVSLVGSLPYIQLLECVNQVDIALDTYPYNGCISTLEGLWMGVPIVSLSGDWYVSRVGRALLSRLGLDVFAAASPDEYVAKAIAFAGQLDQLSAVRRSLRTMILDSPLCDPKRLGHELEQAYQGMWHHWCRRQGVSVPDHTPTAYLRQVTPVQRPEEASPKDVDIPVDEGVCLQQAHEAYQRSEFDRAECLYRHLAQQPARFEVYSRLAQICEKDMSRQSEALAWLNQARQCDPANWDVQKRIAVALQWTGHLDQAVHLLEQLVNRPDTPPDWELMLLWWKQYQVQCDPAEMAQRHRQWARANLPMSRGVHDYTNERSPDKRLRIGYLSGDFRAHSVAYNVKGTMVEHDRAQCEVYGYGSVSKPDHITAELSGLFDAYRDVYALSDHDLVQCIRRDQIDILVLIGGYTANSRFNACSFQPAPILVDHSSIDTMGMEQFTYRLTDPILDPPELPDYYDEEKCRLPGGLICFTPPRHAPLVSRLPAARFGQVTFGCLNNIAKVNSLVLDLWADILNQCPDSRMVLKFQTGHDPGARAHCLDQFAQRKITSDRIDIYSHFPSQFDHLKLFSQIDIALDTYPYNGCVTTLEGLWMGVPVVTLTGDTFMSRNGDAIMSRLGLDEWITNDPGVYVDKAVGFARDRDALASLRSTMRQRLTDSVVCDQRRFARELEDAYRMMWKRWAHE